MSENINTNLLASSKKLPIIDYQIVYNLEMFKINNCLNENSVSSSFQCVYKGPANFYKVNKLDESSSYLFRISALNETGQGEWSDNYQFKTTKSPPLITKGN